MTNIMSNNDNNYSSGFLDFESSTTQEKFIMMMNDRIGKMEETLFELNSVMLDTMTTHCIQCEFNFPSILLSDLEVFLDKIKLAVEKTLEHLL